MLCQSLEPVKLVDEFRPRLRISVGRIQAADQDSVHGCFEVAGLRVGGIAGQFRPRDDRLAVPAENGNPVPGLLAPPYRVVAGIANGFERKLSVGRFQLLQADDIGLGLAQPVQQIGEPLPDIVDVEAGDLHWTVYAPTGEATELGYDHTRPARCSATPAPSDSTSAAGSMLERTGASKATTEARHGRTS